MRTIIPSFCDVHILKDSRVLGICNSRRRYRHNLREIIHRDIDVP